MLRQAGARVTLVDIKVGGAAHDVTAPGVGDDIIRRIRAGEFHAIHIATPCSSFSINHDQAMRTDGMRVTSKAVPPYWYTCHMSPRRLRIFVPTMYLPLRDILPPYG